LGEEQPPPSRIQKESKEEGRWTFLDELSSHRVPFNLTRGGKGKVGEEMESALKNWGNLRKKGELQEQNFHSHLLLPGSGGGPAIY